MTIVCIKLIIASLAVLILFGYDKGECQRLRSSFGEMCNSSIRCDSKQNLACREGNCECIMPATMTFDLKRESCAVLVGEMCMFTTVEVRNDGEDSSEVQEKIWKEELPCVSEALCSSTSGYCNCISTYKEANNGTCEPKLTVGMKCSSSSECRSDLLLICDGGKCMCNQTFTIYDEDLSRCVSRAGESCAETQTCPTNSECNGEECICNKGYFPDLSDGTCKRKPDHGMPCQSEIGCLEDVDLICRNDICQCNSSTIYDEERERCVVTAGSYCINSYYRFSIFLHMKSCVQNAQCIQAEQDHDSRHGYYYKHVCSCLDGYFKTVQGTCEEKRGVNEPCSSNEECKSDSALSLNCEYGLCQCTGYKTLYDPWKRECVCPNNPGNCADYYYHSCATNSERSSSRSCDCLKGYTRGQDRFCYPSYQSACANNPRKYPPCNVDEGLICINQKCDCRMSEHEYFSTDISKHCYTYVKGPCGHGTNGTVCTPNSECIDVGDGIYQCQCKSGFLPVDGKCEYAFGKQCNQLLDKTEPQCDQVGELNCIEGICKCKIFQTYDKTELRCRGLVGSVCHLDKKNFCVDGAMCKQLRHFEIRDRGVCQCKENFSVNEDRTCSALKSNNQDFSGEGKNSTESYVIMPKLTESELKIGT